MRILIITDSYPPQPDGHAASVAWWEQSLRTSGAHVTVSTPRRMRLREHPDVLFVHGYGLRTAAVIAAYPRVPIVSFVHRHAYLDVPLLFPQLPRFHAPLATWLYQRQQRFLEYSAHILTPSERTASITRAMVPATPISVATTGVAPAFNAGANSAQPTTPPTVLYIGRRSADKNFARLVPLAARTPQWKWHAIGAPGPDDAAARDAGIVLTDHLPTAEVIPAIARASALVLPSEFETQGLAALEALTIGVPVVAPAGSAQAEQLRPGTTGETYATDATDEEIITAIERAIALAPLAQTPDVAATSTRHAYAILQQVSTSP